MNEKKFLALFDVDGTLAKTLPLVKISFYKAFEDVFKVKVSGKISFAGLTDPLIVLKMGILVGLPVEEVRKKQKDVLKLYIDNLRKSAKKEPTTVLNEGVVDFLNRLQEDGRVAMGLITGNIKEGAEIKLSHHGLMKYFSCGAFGDDNEIRTELGKIALERAKNVFKCDFQRENVFIFGDTVIDVMTAYELGAKAVAMGCGYESKEKLLNSKPHLYFDDFKNHEEIYKALFC